MPGSVRTKGTEGLVIATVEPDSAADEAGLREGDMIVSVDQAPLTDDVTLRNAIEGDRSQGREDALFLAECGGNRLFVSFPVTPSQASGGAGDRPRGVRRRGHAEARPNAHGGDDSTVVAPGTRGAHAMVGMTPTS